MRIEQHIQVAAAPDEALAFVADFANLPAWDWSAVRVERLAGQGIALGNRYRVHLGVGPLTTPLDYAVTRYIPGESAVLLSDGGAVRSEDIVSVTSSEGGTRLVYVADLGIGSLGELAAPLVRPLFALHGRVVMARLQAVLDARVGERVAMRRSG